MCIHTMNYMPIIPHRKITKCFVLFSVLLALSILNDYKAIAINKKDCVFTIMITLLTFAKSQPNFVFFDSIS